MKEKEIIDYVDEMLFALDASEELKSTLQALNDAAKDCFQITKYADSSSIHLPAIKETRLFFLLNAIQLLLDQADTYGMKHPLNEKRAKILFNAKERNIQ